MTVQPTRVARRPGNLRANTVHTRVARSIPLVESGGGDSPLTSFLDILMSHAYDTHGPLTVGQLYANNDPVDVYSDEFGGVNAVQATGANQPLWATAVAIMGGRNCIVGNGAAHHLRTADWTPESQKFTTVNVWLRRISKGAGAAMDGKQGTTKQASAHITDAFLHLDGGDGASVTAPVNITGEAPIILEVLWNGAGSKAWLGGRQVWAGTLAADQCEGLTFLDSAEVSGGAKSLLGYHTYGGVRFSGINGGELTVQERADFVTLAKSLVGCEDLTAGVGRYPDSWSRAAIESDGSVTKTLVRTPDAGNLLVASCIAAANHAGHSVTDDLGGTWTKRSQHDQGARGVSIWTKTAIGTEATVTFAAGSGQVQVQIDEVARWSGTFAAADGEDAGVGTTTVTPTVTTVAANSIIFYVVQTDSPGGQEVSWSNAVHAHDGSTSRLHTAHKVVSTAAAHPTAFVWTTSRRAQWAALSIAAA